MCQAVNMTETQTLVSYLVTWTNSDGSQSGREYDDPIQASAVAGWWRDRDAVPVKVEKRTY